MRLSDGIFDTKQVTKRAFDGKGEPKIPNYTWHHHQDTGRMQLVPEEKHSPTGHIGG
ncbi:TPA: HNH endonuclease, partial [Neisseria meningitidis]